MPVCALLLPGAGWTHDSLFPFGTARTRLSWLQSWPWQSPGTALFWSNVGQKSLPEISSNSLIFSSITVSLALACPKN